MHAPVGLCVGGSRSVFGSNAHNHPVRPIGMGQLSSRKLRITTKNKRCVAPASHVDNAGLRVGRLRLVRLKSHPIARCTTEHIGGSPTALGFPGTCEAVVSFAAARRYCRALFNIRAEFATSLSGAEIARGYSLA